MYTTAKAQSDFAEARDKALFQDLVARLTGQSSDLLSFDLVRESLHVHEQVDRGIERIRLDRIVGSAGRPRDFNRHYMPRSGVREDRWSRLDKALHNREHIPPILVYQIGDVYFVEDGNHRVSVARANGLKYIAARVIEIRTRVPLTPDITSEGLGAKADYADFLEGTGLGDLRPGTRFDATTPGSHARLREHIEAHGRRLARETKLQLSQREIALSWHDRVYAPAVQTIRELNLVCNEDGRTETDVYLDVVEYLRDLRKQWGPGVDLRIAAADYARNYPRHKVRRVLNSLQRLVQRIADPGAIPPVVEDLLDRLETQEHRAGANRRVEILK